MMVMVGAVWTTPKGVIRSDNDRRRSVLDDYWLRHGLSDRSRGWRLLHGRDNSGAHPLLLKQDQIARLQRPGNSMRADMVDDQLFVHPAPCHRHHIVDGHRPGGHLATKLLLDHGPIAGFHLVHFRPDRRTAKRADPCTDRGASPRIAHRVADQSPNARTGQAADRGPSIPCDRENCIPPQEGQRRLQRVSRNEGEQCDPCNAPSVGRGGDPKDRGPIIVYRHYGARYLSRQEKVAKMGSSTEVRRQLPRELDRTVTKYAGPGGLVSRFFLNPRWLAPGVPHK